MDIYTRKLTQLWDSDVVVVGSGSAGAAAAIAAARTGARTTLVERFVFLGGTSTQVLHTFYGFYTPGSHAYKVVGGIPDDVVTALKQYNAAFERQNSFGAGTGMTYDIPYRTLVSEEKTALVVAGRCFSATHDAHASCRSMAQTMTMGQAAGTDAALAVKTDTLPHELEVGRLQAKLVNMGAKFGEIRAKRQEQQP